MEQRWNNRDPGAIRTNICVCGGWLKAGVGRWKSEHIDFFHSLAGERNIRACVDESV